MGLLLQIFYVMETRNNAATMPTLIVYLRVPGVFAARAGALLIGQEKENRTLGWLASLPIAPRDLLRVKLLSALLGLLVVWVFSLLLALTTSAWRDYNYFELIWPVNSLFILLLGVATAWYFKSSLISLLVVLPLACLPLLTVQLFRETKSFIQNGNFRWDQQWEPWLNVSFVLLFSCVALWCGWRFGNEYLSPTRVPTRATRSPVDAGRFAWLGSVPRTPWSPFSALVWQAAAQSRLELSIVTVLILVMVGLPLLPGPFGNLFGIGVPMSAFVAFALSVTLGVVVFQGDSIQNRVRFLADRGIAPACVWCSRQFVPLSVLILSLLLIALLTPLYQTYDRSEMTKLIPLATLMFGFVFSTYATSQWVSQLTRSPIVAAVTAMLGAMIAIAYLAFAMQEMESPVWLLVPTGLIPFLVTFLMTRRWMDGRLGWGYWLSHAGCLAVAVLLPAIPFLSTLTQSTGMSRQLTAQFTRDAERYAAFDKSPVELTFPKTQNSISDNGSDVKVSTLAEQLEQHPGAIGFGQPLGYLLSLAEYTRIRLQAGESEALLDQFRNDVALLQTMVQRLRLSPRLIEQDAADQVERWMLFLVKQANAEELLGTELKTRLTQSLADNAGRDEARRRAIVLSWSKCKNASKRSSATDNLGGYPLSMQAKGAVSLRDLVLLRKSADRQTAILWQYLNATTTDEQSRLRRELAQAWHAPLGAYTLVNEDSDGIGQPLMSGLLALRRPGIAWHGRWEQAER